MPSTWTNWSKETGRLISNPFEAISKGNEKETRRVNSGDALLNCPCIYVGCHRKSLSRREYSGGTITVDESARIDRSREPNLCR